MAGPGVCVECSSVSKYTCPSCGARTCSLACTRAHKSAEAQRRCTPASSAARHDDTPAAGVRAPAGYVSMSQYGEAELLQDYHFLSAMSRATAETGRRIVDLKLLPPASSTEGSGKNVQMQARGMTNQQRQREQLLKQIHYRRFRIMVLPDGMARRKHNQSGFNPKTKRFELSLDLRLPLHLNPTDKQKASESGMETEIRMHRTDVERSIAEVVLAELERRSFGSRKEMVRAKDALRLASSVWLIKQDVLTDAGLRVPSGSTCVSRYGWERSAWVGVQGWSDEWAVHVPVYSARLTNESTTRYLDWWTRKRKWEQANPELAAQQEQEAKRRSNPAEIPQPQPGGAEPENEAVEQVEGAGIVSSSLLAMLSQRLGRTRSEQAVSPQEEKEDEGGEGEGDGAQSMIVRIRAPDTLSLSTLLQTLPEGYAVVEFPELRLVPASHAAEHLVDLGPEFIPPPAPRPAKTHVAQPLSTPAASSTGLGGLLASYDSDSDSDADASVAHDEEAAGSLAALASQHGLVRTSDTADTTDLADTADRAE